METKKRRYAPECYFCNPITGEIGWTIEFPEVYAESKADAARQIKALPNFDCFIDYSFDEFND